ncbi:malto-oligosyltrehalose synthase [Pantoea agglomerans]|uniref:malto-oligosyltrehalose synthase n=1 Tax=Enterobacter agglomerans TaxID=549 RepID=UPI00277F59C7|nr:malto-oligosyltrehalose synthase [Pantoea agglomerans]MDQ0629161.1 (1->4)-alpha-D-glucan 1-alpha-D-glucosylmutase [Pantoea agglomerans]
MNIPTATYRIQFRNGMTFDRAAALVPYLKQLGISHLYASPIFSATAESTHGYDVTDVNQIEPSIGGREGFDRMAAALKAAGLGLILDIVPNHMAASLENPWWRDVIEHGEQSRYAHYFDIDWSRRLTLPFLGDTFEAVLANGEISVKRDPQTGKPALAYFDNFYPLAPETWQDREEAVLALRDAAEIAELHEQQPWRLMSWRDAPNDLSYRRFFEVTGLVGVRVEDKTVFDAAHQLILELVHSGAVQGLRVDHVDGLADPHGYLEQLRQAAGPDCYLTVEKILGDNEQLPDAWPVSGTTGYEFMAALANLLVDSDQLSGLRKAYQAVIGKTVDMKAELRAAKLLMANRNFAGEFNRLLQLALKIADAEGTPQPEAELKNALRELLVAFPVYRTYGTPQGLTPADTALLQQVVSEVKASAHAPDSQALDFLTHILRAEVADSARDDATQFRTRFQQLTGPLMAKSVEDTLFFRQHMALALNEVGAEPLARHFSLDQFHAEMQARREHQPDALSGTSTHDTKRGEDARARLYTLTEAPQRWAECVNRWREMNHDKVVRLKDGPAPEPAVEWMLYEALAGVWPTTLQPQDAEGLAALEARFVVYVEKALREAKLRTDWADNNDAYEEAVLGYARHLLAPANSTFLSDFCQSLQPFMRAGLVNSLTQTVVKLTAPGVPDIYQGSEALDFSLVDPDNRREPDFDALAAMLNAPQHDGSEAHWLRGQVNQQAIVKLLTLRQQQPALFRYGDYLALSAEGEQQNNVLAFARTGQDQAVIVVVSRRVFNQLPENLDQPPAARWADTVIALPTALGQRRYQDVLTGKTVAAGDQLPLTGLASQWCAVLVAQ